MEEPLHLAPTFLGQSQLRATTLTMLLHSVRRIASDIESRWNWEADTLTYTVALNAADSNTSWCTPTLGPTGGMLFELLVGIAADIGTIDTGAIGRPASWGDAAGGLVSSAED